jgi:hypothetical protein
MKPSLPPVSLTCHITGRAAGAERDILERELFGQVAPEQRQRHVLVGAVLVDLAHRHGLDHRHVHALAMCPFEHFGDLGIVEALERHGVDLDLQARRLRRTNAVENLAEIAPPGDLGELVRIQRVDRNIDAANPAVMQFGLRSA